MPDANIKLLIVDDSALMRKLLRQIFEAEGGFELAFARNGSEALREAGLFHPDVITLDVNMPEMDGLTCLGELSAQGVTARVIMVSSLTEHGAEATLRALALGAVDFVPKPDGTVSLNIDRVSQMLVSKVSAAARMRPKRAQGLHGRIRQQRAAAERNRALGAARLAATRAGAPGLVLIGVSTGGPRTLEEIVPELPPDFPWPVVIAQHMPSSFTGVFARRMDAISMLDVVEVDSAMPLVAGRVYIGRGDADVTIQRRLGRLIVDTVPSDGTLWHPCANRLVQSALELLPPSTLVGVLLTGMGNDGAEAMTRLHEQGGRTIAEAESTAVVFGMPCELIRQGGAGVVLPADRIAQQLVNWSRPIPLRRTA